MIKPTVQWSESTLRALGLLLLGVTAAGVLANVAISVAIGDIANSMEQVLLLVVFLFALVWLIRSVPRNTAVWALVWGALAGGLSDTFATITLWRTGVPLDEFLNGSVTGSPADLELLSAIALDLGAWGWLGIFVLTVHFVLLFPSGQVSSRRWLFVLRGATVVIVSAGGIVAVGLAPWVTTSFADLAAGGPGWAFGLAGMPLALASAAAIANLIVRFRRSSGEVRLQYRWIAWAFSLWVLAFLVSGLWPEASASSFIYTAALAALPVSVGIAITRHRLYDIDVVISRTLVYGALAIFIGAVYVGIVVGLGYLIGDQDGSTWLQLLATVIIAIAFQPLRRWLQQLANRIVFGRSATPYEVLSSFSQVVSAVDPDVLTEVARSLADGTTAVSASIWVDRGDHLQCIASWPDLPGDEPDPSAISEPVIHKDDLLGFVVLAIPPGQPFPETDQRLLEQVAAGLGLALRNLQLTVDLRDRVDELAASRRRIVTVQDETRRKLERDLHDGAQQRLVSLKIKLGIASSMAEKAGLEDVKAMVDTVRGETDETIESVRDFARGIYPPLLEAEGLESALSAQARKMPIPVVVRAAGLQRYPKEHEATVYFCVLEALQNAMKHSQATSVQVLLSDQGDELAFEVRDDGVGFDQASVVTNGLLNMRDRTEAVGGEFKVESEPGRGTTIIGSLPIPELAAA